MTKISTSSVHERLAGGMLSIDLDALVANWKFLNEKSGKAQAAAVVKANGYGLGLEPVVHALYLAGCRRFFVAFIDEGIRARKIAPKAEIFVFNGMIPHSEGYYVENNLIPVLCSLDDIKQWGDHGKNTGVRRPCAVHFDTGINRMGLSHDELVGWAEDPDSRFSITPLLAMSHLANADNPSHPMNTVQLERFNKSAKLFDNVELSLANSGGVMMGDDFHFSITRPGIALYGAEYADDAPALQRVVSLYGRIMQIRSAKKGESIGYGAACKLERDSRIAVVSVGYADGYSRSLSGHGVALRNAVCDGGYGAIGEHLVPLVGRVSMDMVTFDVSDVPEGQINNHDWVELFGEKIALDDAARAAGTIGYEFLTNLSQRHHRKYYLDGKIL